MMIRYRRIGNTCRPVIIFISCQPNSFTTGATQAYFNPYETPYDAYINYMNVLSDFAIRVNAMVPVSSNDQEIAGLTQVIAEKDELIQ